MKRSPRDSRGDIDYRGALTFDRAQLAVRAQLALARCRPDDVRRLRDSVTRARDKSLQLTAVSELPPRVAALVRHDDDDFVQLHVLALALDLRPDARAVDALLALGRWAQAGLPTLQLSGAQAAALMLSDLSDEQLDGLAPPWRSFRIELEDPHRADGVPMARLQVHVGTSELNANAQDWWQLYCYSRHLAFVGGRPRDLRRGLLEWDPGGKLAGNPNYRPPTDAEGRALVLLQRLVLNVSIALQGAAGECAASLVEDGRAKGKRAPGAPRRFRMDLETNSDMSEHIADYLSGDVDRIYKIRWIVSGHWRNQPHGPGGMLRKRIWIAPFWKGPEGAPPKR